MLHLLWNCFVGSVWAGQRPAAARDRIGSDTPAGVCSEGSCHTDPVCSAVPRAVVLRLQAENRDLKQVDSGSLVGGLLAKGLTKGLGGLGRLGLGSITAPMRRVRIDDYATVLLFVVGGISPVEVRQIQTELEQHVYGHKPRVIVGGTTLLSPGEASRLFFS